MKSCYDVYYKDPNGVWIHAHHEDGQQISNNQLMNWLRNKYIYKCNYCKSIKRENLYNGYERYTVYHEYRRNDNEIDKFKTVIIVHE